MQRAETLNIKEFVGQEVGCSVWAYGLRNKTARKLINSGIFFKTVAKSSKIINNPIFFAEVLIVEWGQVLKRDLNLHFLKELSIQVVVICSEDELLNWEKNPLLGNNVHWVGIEWSTSLIKSKIHQAQYTQKMIARVKTQEALKSSFFNETQNRSLVALQTMGEGLAHEISQPLFIIQGFLHKIQRSVASGLRKNQNENFERIFESIGRIDRIVKHFKEFSQQSEKRMVPISINESVERALRLVNGSLESNGISLERVFSIHELRVLGGWEPTGEGLGEYSLKLL